MTETASVEAEETPATMSITVDGREIEARPGEVIIAAAERAGIYIPRFCWHPRLRPVGMCRMCLVELEGPRGPQLVPSCYIAAADGQVVNTQETSEQARRMQEGVLEFLLVNHPLDCPVCDKGGECPLQDQTMAHGPGETRFVEEKRHWEKPIALSDLVLIDRERCIQCDRCTRFADEVAGDPLIEFINRGDKTEINVFPDEPFSSYFSGNTVQLCPVGALLSVPYRFRARPWDLDQAESTCTTCAFGCRIAVQSSGNAITRYLGLDSDPVNQGWLCDKGRFGYEAVNSAERLAHPMVRRGDALAEAAWGEALRVAGRALADAVRLHGPESVAVIGGARLPNEDAYAWAKLTKGVLGTDSVDCQLGDGLPAEAVLGLPRATIDEACRAPVVLLLAPDLREELPVLYLRLRAAAVDAGHALVELTPRPTGLTRYARASLGYRAGESPALARALVGDSAEPAAGVPADLIASAREVLRSGGDVVVVLGRPSVAESAASIAEAAAALAEGLPGARFLSALRRGNVHGALDMGLAPGVLPGRVGLGQAGEALTSAWDKVPERRGRDTAAILADAAEGRIQCLVLLGADPVSDFPDRELARRGLGGAGTVIAVDAFVNESNRQAAVVLPAATFAERSGTTTNIEGRVTRLGRKVTPPGVAWPDWMIATQLAAAAGADLGLDSLEAIWDEIERVAPSHSGITRETIAASTHRDGVLAGERAASGASSGANGGTFGEWAARSEPPAADSYSLRLVSSRVLYDRGTTVQRSPSLERLVRPQVLQVNPYDLDRLGVATGDRVRVRSSRGTLVLEVAPEPGLPRGSAALPFNAEVPGAADLIDSTAPVTDIRLETIPPGSPA